MKLVYKTGRWVCNRPYAIRNGSFLLYKIYFGLIVKKIHTDVIKCDIISLYILIDYKGLFYLYGNVLYSAIRKGNTP